MAAENLPDRLERETDLAWPPVAQVVLKSVFGIVAVDFDLVRVECAVTGWAPGELHFFKLGVPVGVSGIVVVTVLLAGTLLENSGTRTTRAAKKLSLTFAGAAYTFLAPILVRQIFVIADCRACGANETRVCLAHAPSVGCSCIDSDYVYLFWLSLAFGVLWAFCSSLIIYSVTRSWEFQRDVAERGTRVPWYTALTEFSTHGLKGTVTSVRDFRQEQQCITLDHNYSEAYFENAAAALRFQKAAERVRQMRRAVRSAERLSCGVARITAAAAHNLASASKSTIAGIGSRSLHREALCAMLTVRYRR